MAGTGQQRMFFFLYGSRLTSPRETSGDLSRPAKAGRTQVGQGSVGEPIQAIQKVHLPKRTLGLQPYAHKVVRPPPPQPPSQELVGALGRQRSGSPAQLFFRWGFAYTWLHLHPSKTNRCRVSVQLESSVTGLGLSRWSPIRMPAGVQ